MLRCKPGGEQWVRAWMDVQSARPTMSGWVSTSIYRADADPNLLWVVVMFESREAYHANAATPTQDHLYRQMLSGLEEPPTWHDGEIISHSSVAQGAAGG
jgi:hypothetical protein